MFSEKNADLLSAYKISDYIIDLNEKELLYKVIHLKKTVRKLETLNSELNL